jgi:hypothetical protein
MDYKFFYKSILNILFTPAKAWVVITSENRTNKHLKNSLLYPLFIIVSIAAFAGSLIFINTSLSAIYSVFKGLKFFILLLTVTYFSSWLLGEITKPLDLGKNFTTSFRLIAYSLIPLILCQVASQLFESLIFVNVFSLYGLYIFWTGAEHILNPPDYKKMPLLIAIFTVTTAAFLGFDWVLTSIFDRIYFGFLA